MSAIMQRNITYIIQIVKFEDVNIYQIYKHIFPYSTIWLQFKCFPWLINKRMDNKEQNMAELYNEEAHNKRY